MSTFSPASRIQANLEELFQGNVASGNAYIKFQLSSEITALLPMTQVEKSLIVEANQITPLPGMSASVIGMINSRDRVFCVFDLAQLLNISYRENVPQHYQIIVLETNIEPQINIGLAVNQLQGIVRFPDEQIQSSMDTSSNIAPYLRGEVRLENILFPILDFNLILNSLVEISKN